MDKIELKNISKYYENNNEAVIKDFNLSINPQDFVVFVGPSGCGKSTTLRMIAGIEEITSGEIFINQQKMNEVEPKDRGISMVFQSYALFPHMTVQGNLSFGLKVRKVAKEKIKELVTATSRMIGLETMLQQLPKSLSGGQRQRVALGRAVVKQSDIFLMDEPLSNLDAKLRSQMREEIIRLHRELGATTIYVTHDQVEAMTMATRIVVLNQGDIQQVGTPYEIFNEPANRFVASFIGTPGMNFIAATVQGQQLKFGELLLANLDGEMPTVENVDLGIRPEAIEICGKDEGLAVLVDYIELLGSEMLLHVLLGKEKLILKTCTDITLREGQTIFIRLPLNQIYLFDQSSGQTLFSKGELLM